MDKLKMHSVNKVDKNVEKIAQLFPNCVTESLVDNKLTRVVDFDMLKQELSSFVVEGREERYQFTWPDKKRSVLLANAPIKKTLRPVRNDETKPTGSDSSNKPYCSSGSVNFDTTENLYIEGDNLEVLKLLQETYLGKIKMIYIDPPYNTGNDFVYKDDFAQDADEYLANSGQYDDEGNRLVQNTERNGRFHTDWLNMIYPRLKLAKDLLTDDGVIFISIDDNEVAQIRKNCDDIFGERNFVAQLVWERAFSPKNDARYVSNSHDYVLMYAKHLEAFVIGRLPRTDEANARYSNPDNDLRGPWMSSDISVKTYNAACDYPITAPSGRVIEPPAGRCWSLSKNSFLERLQDNRIWFGPDGDGVPRIKRFLTDLKHEGMAPTSIMFFKDVGHSQEGSQEVSKLLVGGFFNGPKPTRLLRRLLTLANTESDSLILDFFSGSATTAHAVMQLNAEDGGHRKFIMVQLAEETDEKSEAYKAGYKNICEIGKERIRRAGKKILQEVTSGNGNLKGEGWGCGMPSTKEELSFAINNIIDIGFRVLKCDSSNMKDVYYNPSEYSSNLFPSLTDNIKDDRTPEDLLFQVMLDLGVLLSSKIEETTIAGKRVFSVADGYLIACFDENITNETIKAIAQKKPYYFVMRDGGYASDSVATNFEQIFAAYSPSTIRKVL